MTEVIVFAASMGAWFAFGWTMSNVIAARRRRKAVERAVAAADESTRTLMRVLAQTFGGFTGYKISPADIRAGDEIHWHAPDERPCIDYTAGFNGDVAGKTTGEWIRKDQGEEDQ